MPNAELLVSESSLEKLEGDYPALNVRQEIVKMQNWWAANPRRRKKNEYRFVINWLNREHAKVAMATANVKSYANVGEGHRTPSTNELERGRTEVEEILKKYPELR